MSTQEDLEKLGPIINDVNTKLADGYRQSRDTDERVRMTAGDILGYASTVLRYKLFGIVAKNPDLHIELFTGVNGIEAHDVVVNQARAQEGTASQHEHGVKSGDAVKLVKTEGAGPSLLFGNDELSLKMGTLARVVAEGGRIVVIDESSIADEPSTSE